MEEACHPTRWRAHQLGPQRADPLSPSLLATEAPGHSRCCFGLQRPAGPRLRAWVLDNILAQNYIRLEVSIFCSILLPDLIVHLWQCLYTSLVQDNSVAVATGARQCYNLEINSFRACLFPRETPSPGPGSMSTTPFTSPHSYPIPNPFLPLPHPANSPGLKSWICRVSWASN